MDDDIRAKLNGTAENRSGKSVVYNQRNLMRMGNLGKFFFVKYGYSRIGQRFTENQPGIGANLRGDFIGRSIGIDKSTFNAQTL